jgi:SLT domain-containing protein
MRESGWNQHALNASSGAYGIPQALPASKMGAAANPPESNPTAQINWMISYIKGRYGDPIGAEAHEQSAGWYDQGGWLMPGQTLATNGTGKPERVVSPAQEKAAAGGPRVVNHNTFAYYGPQQPTPEMQQAMLVNLASMVGAAG